MTNLSLSYRSDIDGLRAVAVLSVIVFHAFPGVLPGGFIGVDIFFVISGYLIGGILIKGVDAGTFSFSDFYARRIRRIFPALAIVLACCLALGWRVLLADEYKALAEQAGAGALFFSNILLWMQTGYFDADATLKPLLHLWSLGVEEQFYIVWPPIVLLAYRLRWNLATVAVTLAIVSFWFNVHTIHTDPTGAFFLPHTRMWEPLIGCTLAWFAYHRGAHMDGAVPNVKAWTGAALITYAALRLDNAAPFPGWWALLPTLGAALVIWAGPRAALNRIVLSSRAMICIGLVSYPLYLWHWPLLSFATICGGKTPSTFDRLGLLAISFALATLTYLVVERQVRYRHSRIVPLILAGLMLFVAGGSYATYSENGYPSRVERFVRIEQASGQWDYPSSDMTTTQFEGIPVRELDSHIKNKVLFIGDSNMEMYWPRVQQLIHDKPDQVKSAVFVTNKGCPPIPGVEDQLHPNCNGWIAKAAQYANTREFDTVVVASNWLGYFNFGRTYSVTRGDTTAGMTTKDGLRESLVSLQAMLEGFRKNGRNVVLVLNIPNNYALASRNLVSRSITGFRIKEGGIPRKDFAPFYHDVRTGLVRAAQATGSSIVDPMDDLCQDGFCSAWFGDGGDPIYKDGDHLSALFARHNATFIDQTIALH